PVRVRSAMQDHGPTFVNLFQDLSTSVDLLPPERNADLSQIHNAVPPLPSAANREQLAPDHGAPPAAELAFLDQTPLAAASLAHAH
ncbi:ubiquinone biosynthesis protein UbiB, partial [Stenotrophomonas maltophilia]